MNKFMKKFMRKFKKVFYKIHAWIQKFKIKNKIVVRKNEKIVVLENNLCYADWIESVERQVLQTKIDYAFGWIDSTKYENMMAGYKKKIKDISDSYLEYMKRNKVSIPKELAAQYS